MNVVTKWLNKFDVDYVCSTVSSIWGLRSVCVCLFVYWSVCGSASREWRGGLRSAWLSARVKTGVCWPDPVSRKLDLGRYSSDKTSRCIFKQNHFTTVCLSVLVSCPVDKWPTSGWSFFKGLLSFYFFLLLLLLLLATGFPKKNLKCLLVGGLTDLFLYWIGYVKPTRLPVNEVHGTMTDSTELKEWIELIPYDISRSSKQKEQTNMDIDTMESIEDILMKVYPKVLL